MRVFSVIIPNMNINAIKQEVNWSELLLGILALMPILIGYGLFHNALLLKVGLVTISLYIPIARTKSGLYLVVPHFLLIGLCFSLLYFSMDLPYLFVLFVAGLAFGSIYLTSFGANLRTLGNFIFIPAVYLACELRENLQADAVVPVYIKFITLMPIALISIIVLMLIVSLFTYYKKSKILPSGSHAVSFMHHVFYRKNSGEVKLDWLKEAMAIFLGVAIAAFFVVFMHITRGEWIIWSTAAVITLDITSAKKKMKDRLIGLSIGIPVGFFVAQFLPKTQLMYSVAVLGIMLTLIAFKNYRMAFGSRCFFIAMVSYLATATPQIAVERLENVVIGSIIGMAAVYICHRVLGNFGRR